VENDTTDITRNGLSGEHRPVTAPDDSIVTDTTNRSVTTWDAPAAIPAEDVPSEDVATSTATDVISPDVTADDALTDIAIAEPLPEVAVNQTLAGITAEELLRDKRKSWKSDITPEADAQTAFPDAKTVREAVRKRFEKASDCSIRKRLAAILFEPSSPFDSKVPRSIRLETLVLGSILGATVVAMAFFTVWTSFAR
jgi:hypothetical protein